MTQKEMQETINRYERALDDIWEVVRGYDTRPNVSIRILTILEELND